MRNLTNTHLFIFDLYSTIALTGPLFLSLIHLKLINGETQNLERISILISLYKYKKNILIYLYKSKRFGI